MKDLKLLKKRSASDFKFVNDFVNSLAKKGAKKLEKHHRPHKLSGKYKGYWECHIKPDLLLIWKEDEQGLTLELVRTGTHSNLF